MAIPGSNPRVPFPSHPLLHSTPIQIRFADIDILGHVNNNAYLSYLDLGKAHYMTDVLPATKGLKDPHSAIVSMQIDFTGQTFFHDKIETLTAVTAIGTKSFTMEQRVICPETGDVRVIARSILAGFDKTTGQAVEISPAWIEAMELFEGRNLRN